MAIKKSGFNIDIDKIPQLFAGIQALSNVHQGATWDVLGGGKTVDQSLGDVANEMKKGAYQDYLDEQEAMLDQFRATGDAMNLEGFFGTLNNILGEGYNMDPLAQEGYQLPPWQLGMVSTPGIMAGAMPGVPDPYLTEQWGELTTQGMSQEEAEAIIRMAEQEQAGTGGGFMDFLSGIGTYEDPELGTQFLSPEAQGAFLGPSTVIPPSDYEEYAGDLLAASDQDAEMGLPSGMGFLSQLVNDPATVDIVGIDTYQRFFDTYRDNSSVFDPSLIGDIQKALEEAYILKGNVADFVSQGMFDEANALIEEAYKDPIAPYIPTSSPEDYWNQSMFTEYKPGFIPEPYVAPDHSVTNILDPRTGKIVQTVRDAEGNVVSPLTGPDSVTAGIRWGGYDSEGQATYAGGAIGWEPDEADIFNTVWARTPGLHRPHMERMKGTIAETGNTLFWLMNPSAYPDKKQESPDVFNKSYENHMEGILTKGYANFIKELGSIDSAMNTLIRNFQIYESGDQIRAMDKMTDLERQQYTTHIASIYNDEYKLRNLAKYVATRGLPEGFEATSGIRRQVDNQITNALSRGMTPYQVMSMVWNYSGGIDTAPTEQPVKETPRWEGKIENPYQQQQQQQPQQSGVPSWWSETGRPADQWLNSEEWQKDVWEQEHAGREWQKMQGIIN